MKVRFLGGVSDEQVNWGVNDDPRGVLVVGQVFEVDRVEERALSTRYHIGGKRYNSVNFRETCDEVRHMVYPGETLCDCGQVVRREVFP